LAYITILHFCHINSYILLPNDIKPTYVLSKTKEPKI
jgi:hypothetical protein